MAGCIKGVGLQARYARTANTHFFRNKPNQPNKIFKHLSKPTVPIVCKEKQTENLELNNIICISYRYRKREL